MSRTAIRCPAPAGVTLTRDEHGVPHVHADSLEGAHWGMGYGHAMDRSLQMLMMRILGQGRASELLSSDDEMLEVDRFFRRMNWSGAMEAQVRALAPETRAWCDRYCDGINARLSRRMPLELRLLGVRYEPWRIEDCVLLSRMMGYLTLAQSQAEVERLFVEMVQAGVDDERLRSLFPNIPELHAPEGYGRELLEKVRLGERVVPEALIWASPMPRMMASNNWVVAPRRSASGHAVMANDPHLETNRLPNVWCEQAFVIEGPPRIEVACATVPGLPAPLVGRNRNLAWGATYTFMDAVDSWIEQVEDGKYRRGDQWLEFETRTETIRRKGKDPVEVVVHSNEHGVVDGDPAQAGYLLCTRWSSADSGSRSLDAAAHMWTAATVADGMDAVGRIETAWNWVLADGDGNIGYQMSGLMPQRREGVSGFVPRPGWNDEDDWQGFVPPEQLPRVMNPSQGYIVTANQDLNDLGVADPINMPMGDYRARRIADLIEASAPLSRSDHTRIHMDVWSIQAEAFMEHLRPLLPETEAGQRLAGWDLEYGPDSAGAPLFEAWYRQLYVEVFGRGGLGEQVLRHLQDGTGVFIDFYQNFDRVLLAESSPWLGERSRNEVYRSAFDSVADQPKARWGDRNQISLDHMLFGGKLPRWLGFDKGPIALRGGRATPHQGQVYRSGNRATSFAPSLRIIADMGETVLHTALAGGPSDRRWSRFYASDLTRWQEGQTKVLEP
ncbi:MAG: penicillin acylase family protein [Myxococcota bacterium]